MLTKQVAAAVVGMLLGVGSVASGQAISPKPAGMAGKWGDQGDGTFINPVVPADYSDIDVIRVGDDYYAMSSTFQFSPGVVILHSKDLVNWEIAGHAVEDLTKIGPEMNWDRMNRYGRGIWAGAMRYHNGKFYVYFGTPDEGFFMTTAKDVAGPWEPLTQVWKVKGWDDPCPFWDEDGQGYFVCSNFSGQYQIHLFKMAADGKSLLQDSDKVIYQSRGSEANKLYKIDGIYYHFFSEVHAEGRVTMMNRAKSLEGPWETKQLNHVAKAIDKEPNQGGLIQVPSGEWWFLSHQGTGDWEGRAMVLLPVMWREGWPIIGEPGSDGIGRMVWSAKKPVAGIAVVVPQTDEEFDGKALGVQWEWNYAPRAEKWSLTERPGYLRLHAFAPLKAGDLMTAGNTLTQRSMRTERNEVTVKLEIGGMADGQEAGLCHFAKGYSMVGIVQAGDVRTLTYTEGGKRTSGPKVEGKEVWIRSTWGLDGVSQYAYSVDGKTFTAFGPPYRLTWGNYRGDRLGIYSFNDKERAGGEAGFVDVDHFHYEFAKPAGAKETGRE